MNLNTILKKIIYLIGLVIITIPVDAFVVGYTKLKCRNVQIDLLYDVHLPGPVSTSRLSQLSYEAAKSMCFPTERRFLSALENIDRKHEVDLIWESDPDKLYEDHSAFLGFGYAFTRYRFSTINHILADTARSRFLKLFNVAYRRNRNVIRTNYSTYDYHNPYILTSDRRAKIIGNWGRLVLDKFDQFMHQAFTKLKSYFAPYFNTNKFVDDENYDQVLSLSHLADVEMLSYILSSQKQRIIVYIGAEHARRIVSFLRSLDFVEEEHFDDRGWEPLSPDQLNALDRDCLSVSNRTWNPISVMPTVVPHFLPSDPVVINPPTVVVPVHPHPVRYVPATPIHPATPSPVIPAPTSPGPVPRVMPASIPAPMPVMPVPVRSGGMPALPVSVGAGTRSIKNTPKAQRGRGNQQRSAVVRRKVIGVIVKRAISQKNNAIKRPIGRRGKQIIRRAPAQMHGKNADNKNRRTVGMRANGLRKRR